MLNKQISTIFLFSLLITLGVLFRMEPVLHWQDKPDIFFANDQPVSACIDGYYYLNIAKEIGENSYSPIDVKRGYPEKRTRSPYPSLLPILLHYFSSVFHVSLNWVAIWLPVFLGVSLLLPVYLFSKYLGGTVTVIGSLAFAAFSPFYGLRTRLGWLDTDCLNVVLPLFCAYCFMQFGLKKTHHRYIYLTGGLLFFLLFLWWWDMTPAAVIVLALSPLVIALLVHFRPERKEGTLFFIISFTIIVLIILSIDTSQIIGTVKSAFQQLSYTSKQSLGLFPNIGLSIQEQQTFSPLQTLSMVIPNLPCQIFTAIGLIFLCLQQRSKMFYLLPMALIGCFSFFFAKRYAIFLTPICAISFGYFFSLVSCHIQKRFLFYLCYFLAIISLAWSGFTIIRDKPMSFAGEIIEGMQAIQEKTPEESVIWSWWDEGHPLVYWADRATLGDGMVHGGERNFYMALPLVTSDFRLSANFMRFYSVRGIAGINLFLKAIGEDFTTGISHLETILSLGPADGQDYLQALSFNPSSNSNIQLNNIDYYYPKQTPPIYLFLDERMIKGIRWTYWFGTWDTAEQTGQTTLPTLRLNNIDFDAEQTPSSPAINLDMKQGLLTIKKVLPTKSQINSITTITSADSYDDLYSHATPEKRHYLFSDNLKKFISKKEMLTDIGIYNILLDIPRRKFAIMDRKLSDSLMVQLFTFGDRKDHKYFKPIDTSSDHYQIWKVMGDSIENNLPE